MADHAEGSGGTPGTEHFLQEVDPDALKVVRRLLNAGHEAYLVGGCVRDLYLKRRPKDFDIATSATPEAIRKLFRNSRIIGRRFRLAHVFFGSKIIETSTFRTAPNTSGDDLLITQDNEWGSVEDDARRRDFTINGLFFDVETGRIVDFVDGMDDLDGRVIRTIGDPKVRFQEDPVRMIRAVKFAARLGFDFDPTTWDALLEVAPDILKCSQARVLEEVYKLLRGGAARRSFELMLETKLMQHLMPKFLELFGDDDGADRLIAAQGAHTLEEPHSDEGFTSAELFWRYVDALDEFTRETQQVATNGVLLAVLFAPLLSEEMVSAKRQSLDRRIESLMTPVGAVMGIARRDRELARQILMAHHRMVDAGRRRRRSSIAQRQYFHDALVFLGLAVKATGGGGSELEHWRRLAAARRAADQPRNGSGKRRRRGGRRRRSSADGGRNQADSIGSPPAEQG